METLKKKKRSSPTQRSLAYLRKLGWTVEKVEQRLPIPDRFVTRDLFNFIDLIAIDGKRIMGVQTTTMANASKHREKIVALPAYQLWKASGGVVLLHLWRKIGARGERKLWKVEEEVL
jgi:hypothetical protein